MKKNILYLLILILLGGAVYMLYTSEGASTLGQKALTDFAIADTSQVGKVIIDDGRNVIELERRDDGHWSLDDEYIAMPHHIDLMLRTFKAVGVQSPVSKSQKDQVMKIIAGDTRKVEIYDLEGNWIKTWYVGRSTQSNQGTFALLETPQDGLSNEPFVIEYRGFRGYLTTRFHAIVSEWRWTGLFNYPELDFKKVQVETPRVPEAGFSIDIQDRYKGEFTLRDHAGNVLDRPKSKIGEYLGGFQSINVEHFEPDITAAQEDSLLAMDPSFRISVTGPDDSVRTADIYFRKPPVALAARMGDDVPEIDPERVYVHFDGDVAYGQRLTFDKILRTVEDF
ncbi:MAG: hypothetical protein HKN79_02325 [Flavobacteriales bacterium]|nr:hypothetical protein [Flavobacteriales bacterium]